MSNYNTIVEHLLQNDSIIQRSEKWFKKRYNMLTASSISSCLEANTFFTKLDLLKDKVKPFNMEFTKSDATDWGIKYEPIAFDIYQQIYKEEVFEIGLINHSNILWLGASPDGIMKYGKLLEIKCVYSRKNINTIPFYYWIQIQIQMEVCNLDECDLFQCKFLEFDNKFDFDNDKSTFKGFHQNKYWKLNEFTCKLIKRDKIWFNQHFKLLEDFWNKVLLYRTKGYQSLLNDINNKKKRFRSNDNNQISKRLRSNNNFININFKDWVSSFDIKNYIIKDPLIDWLNLYGVKNGFIKDKSIQKEFDFNLFLINKNIEFKEAIYINLKKRFGDDVIKIANICESFSIHKANDTINIIKQQKIPIIFNGILHNYNNLTYSMPCIIIRSDYINKIIKTNINHDNNEPIHYKIIEINFSTISLKSNDKFIKNINNISVIKSNIIMSNDSLNNIQTFKSKYGYILGNKYKFKDHIENNCFHTLGIVDIFDTDKSLIKSVQNAIDWIKDLKLNGDKWNILKPNRHELYPNMCCPNNYPWNDIKYKIAIQNNEISLIWNISVKDRNIALQQNISKFTDVNSNILNINGKNSILIDKIININKQTELKYDKLNNFYKLKQYKLELYVDFETVSNLNDNFYHIINNTTNLRNISSDFLYLIGIGYFYNNKWIYKKFIVDSLNNFNELKIVNEFIKYIFSLLNRFKAHNNYTIFHYSSAEVSIFNKIKNKYNIYSSFNWFDLLQYFKNNEIVIKGCYNFSLKNICNILYNLKIINTKWEENYINATNAMLLIWSANIKYNSICKSPHINKIIKYNEIDCKVLYEIVLFLKTF
jgi:putative phage-type endonuclease